VISASYSPNNIPKKYSWRGDVFFQRNATFSKKIAWPRYNGYVSNRPHASRNQSVDAPEKTSANSIESVPRRRIDHNFFIVENNIILLFNHTEKFFLTLGDTTRGDYVT
jgi:hypothetical protein